jgi:hypothetical protein
MVCRFDPRRGGRELPALNIPDHGARVMSSNGKSTKHRWRFFRAGGVDQARLDTGADLAALETLDQKLWVALSCPVKGLEFDERTLSLIDADRDQRVRANEVIHAVKWTLERLADPGTLAQEQDALPLSAIDASKPEGKRLLDSARQILINLGKSDADAISVADLADTAKIFGQTRFNGDGIIAPDSADDAGLRQVILDIISTHGGEADRSGAPGVSQAKVDAFFADLEAFAAWQREAETHASTVLPFGDATAVAHAAYGAVKTKVDDYFTRCRLAAFDPRALAALNRREDDYLELCAKDFTITADEVRGFPLARIEAGKALPLTDGVNPAWTDAIDLLRRAAVAPLLGKDKASLGAEEWASLGAKLGAYAKWLGGKAGATVEKLGLKRVREILGSKAKADLTRLIAQDKALESQATSIADVEKLARYHRDLHQLLVNFVSFEDFYSRRRKSVFQAGTLYLDGRSCELCVRVDDVAKHGTLAILAKSYLAYCDCVRPATGEKMTIACAFTGGDSDQLMVGRNGVFYDRKGRDWDATVSKIIDNPISIRQAFWAPYKKVMRWIEEQVAKRAAAADAASTDKLTTGATSLGTATQTGQAPAAPKKLDIGVVAALGVAVGGITAALSGLLDAFFGLGIWMPIGIIAFILLISGPSMLIAWLKLRQRNLGPILDANGWAVNGRVKINVPFGGALTHVARLPTGAQRSLRDPYAVKRNPWPLVLVVLAALGGLGYWGYSQGKLYEWSGKIFKEKIEWLKPSEKEAAPPPGTGTPPAPDAKDAKPAGSGG